jgi:hypothetical protein
MVWYSIGITFPAFSFDWNWKNGALIFWPTTFMFDSFPLGVVGG